MRPSRSKRVRIAEPHDRRQTMAQWYEDLVRQPTRAVEFVEAVVTSTRPRASKDVIHEITSEVMARLFASQTRVLGVDPSPDRWVKGIIRNLAREKRRTSRPPRGKTVRADPDSTTHVESEVDPRRQVGDCVPLIPEPYRYICEQQYLLGAKRSSIQALIQSQRAIGTEECRRLFRKAHAMLKCVLEGRSISKRWPRAEAQARKHWAKAIAALRTRMPAF